MSSRFIHAGRLRSGRRRRQTAFCPRPNALDVHHQIGGIARSTETLAVVDPRRPAKPADASVATGLECPRWHVFAPQDQPQVPRELEADVLAHERTQLFKRVASGQQSREALPAERADDDPKLVLHVPHRAPEHGAAPDRGLTVALQARTLFALEPHPVSLELRHLHRHPELQTQPRLEPVGIANRAGKSASEEELGEIAQRVSLERRSLDDANQRAHVPDDRRIGRPVEADHRLGAGPGAVEEEPEAMQKRVEEADEGRIVVVEKALPGVLGQMDRQGAVRAEEAEDALNEPWRPRGHPLEGGDGRWGEDERGLLRKADGLFARAHGVAQTRLVEEGVLDATQGLEEIELHRVTLDLGDHRLGGLGRIERPAGLAGSVHRIALAPSFGAHVITSPRVSDDSAVCTKLFIDTCREKYWCSTDTSSAALPPSNERSSTVSLTSRPRPKAIGPGTG